MKHFANSSWLGITAIVRLALVCICTAGAADAQTTLTVTTTADIVDGVTTSVAGIKAANGADKMISLREAVLAVNNDPGADYYTIMLPAGTCTLTIPGTGESLAGNAAIGDLDITKSNVHIWGAGASTIEQNSGITDRIIEVNPARVSSFYFTIFGVTLMNGKATHGGGAIVCGSPANRTLVMSCTFTNNQQLAPGAYGGAIANTGGGSLSVSECTFTSNTAVGTNGGAIGFDSPYGDTLTVVYSRFTLNSSGSSAGTGGGAIAVLNGIASINRNSFDANGASSAGGKGGAVFSGVTLSAAVIVNNRFHGNTASGALNGSAVFSAIPSINVADNWWGKNAGPTSAELTGAATTSWLQLRNIPSQNPLPAGEAATLTADILGRNAGGPVTAATLAGLPGFSSAFGAPVLGTLSSAATALTGGIGTAVFTAGMVQGAGGASVTVDGQTIGASIDIGAPLPVELTSFTGSASGKAVLLKWETATEVNNAGFEIERAAAIDGSAKQWMKTGYVDGHGTTNAPNSYTFADRTDGTGTVAYRLKQIDRDGAFTYSKEIEIEAGAAPKEFTLSQNYPNPFNPATSIDFTVAETGRATMTVYNTLGQAVAVLFDGVAEAGRYQRATFDGRSLSSGTYFVRLTSGGRVSMKKMLMLK